MSGDERFWNDERIADLKMLFNLGKTASEIARYIGNGTSREAVLGKLWRLGLSRSNGELELPKEPRSQKPKPSRDRPITLPGNYTLRG